MNSSNDPTVSTADLGLPLAGRTSPTRQRVLWAFLVAVVVATFATGELLFGIVATSAELLVFDLFAVAGALGVGTPTGN